MDVLHVHYARQLHQRSGAPDGYCLTERRCVIHSCALGMQESRKHGVPSAAVLDEVRQTGATVRWLEDDPLVAMAQAQLLALRKADARGVDPTARRNLRRAIILLEA